MEKKDKEVQHKGDQVGSYRVGSKIEDVGYIEVSVGWKRRV
jgi:hypothetical protein